MLQKHKEKFKNGLLLSAEEFKTKIQTIVQEFTCTGHTLCCKPYFFLSCNLFLTHSYTVSKSVLSPWRVQLIVLSPLPVPLLILTDPLLICVRPHPIQTFLLMQRMKYLEHPLDNMNARADQLIMVWVGDVTDSYLDKNSTNILSLMFNRYLLSLDVLGEIITLFCIFTLSFLFTMLWWLYFICNSVFY